MLSKINEVLAAFFSREEGQALSEYGLILALVAVVCIVALTALGAALSGILGSITNAL